MQKLNTELYLVLQLNTTTSLLFCQVRKIEENLTDIEDLFDLTPVDYNRFCNLCENV